MTPRTVLILCERAPVKVNPVPAVRYIDASEWESPDQSLESRAIWRCSYCGRRVQVVA